MSISQNRVALYSLLSGCLLGLSACSSSNDPPTSESDDPDGSMAGQSVGLQYPADTDDDDRPGMIVTGLNSQDSSTVTSPWFVHTSLFRLESKTPGTGDGFVSLLEYDPEISVSRVVEFYERDLDTCRVDGEETPAGAGDNDSSESVPLISGGSSVTINTPGGPWFIYYREADGDNVVYNTDNGLPGALPEGATLSIPGDTFPTVAAYPMYEPAAPVRLLPDTEETVTADSVYSWIPSAQNAYVKVNFKAYDENDDFQGFLATCYLVDDGSFDMPENVREFVTNTPYRLETRYSRVYNRVDLIDGIIYFQDSEVAE